jgi:prepilin-type N-terminal cleavage/methylation domain-containing protein
MTETIRKSGRRQSGFTLIELLIVIGLLAALAAVLLPSLMGTREDALAGIDKYNAAGTLRTLRQYATITGQLPNGMHTGLEASTSTTLMKGVTEAFEKNAKQSGSIAKLEDEDIDALEKIGITKLAYGEGNSTATGDVALGYRVLAVDDYVITLTDAWKGEGDEDITFNGKGYAALEDEGYVKVINLFLTPTADWSAKGTSWVKDFSVKMDVPGTCPIVDDEFSYYTVFIGIKHSEATFTTSVNSTDSDNPLVPLPPSKDKTGTVAVLQTAIDAAYTGQTGWSEGSWSSTDDGATKTFTKSGGTGGTVTYTIHFNDKPSAELLGTSCPEHGITNP